MRFVCSSRVRAPGVAPTLLKSRALALQAKFVSGKYMGLSPLRLYHIAKYSHNSLLHMYLLDVLLVAFAFLESHHLGSALPSVLYRANPVNTNARKSKRTLVARPLAGRTGKNAAVLSST